MAAMLRTFILRNDMNAAALWAFLKNNWKPMATDGKPLAVTVCEPVGVRINFKIEE